MNDFNMNENTMNKIKDMMNNGDISQIMSQIPPDMIQNLSSMMQNNNNSNNSNNSQKKTTEDNTSNNFDFSNIDMATLLKVKSVMEKMNTSNDPRSNLLHSLKPYLRDSKKEKLDQYANLMNVAKIAEIFKNDNKENNNNG